MVWSVAFSPDGTTLAFVINQDGQSVLHVAASLGAVRILNKPFSMQTLVRTVNDVLRSPLRRD